MSTARSGILMGVVEFFSEIHNFTEHSVQSARHISIHSWPAAPTQTIDALFVRFRTNDLQSGGRLRARLPASRMRYFWSPRAAATFAIAAIVLTSATVTGSRSDSFATAQPWQPQHGRHLMAFQVEAYGGPVSQNCSAAPWRVRDGL